MYAKVHQKMKKKYHLEGTRKHFPGALQRRSGRPTGRLYILLKFYRGAPYQAPLHFARVSHHLTLWNAYP